MSQIVTENQPFHSHNTYNTDNTIHTMQHNLYTISQESDDIALLNELLSTEENLKKSNDHFGAGTDVDRDDLIQVETPPIIKIDLNNNYGKDLESIFEEKKKRLRKESLRAHEPTQLEPVCLPPTYSCQHVSSSQVTVSGADISDIPTSYAIPKLAPHEKAVVGTYVDLMITPGYPYRVRLNGTDDFLFDGKPLTLKSVGQGYGKRLVFDGDDILNNDNYFWSDNNPPNGFALSICLNVNGDYQVKADDGTILGLSAVTSVRDEQLITRLRCPRKNDVELEVNVQFTCKLFITGKKSAESVECALEGIAKAKKTKYDAIVSRIENVIVPGYGACVLEKF